MRRWMYSISGRMAGYVVLSGMLLGCAGCRTLSGDGVTRASSRKLREEVALVNTQAADILSAQHRQTGTGVPASEPDKHDSQIRQGDQLRINIWMRDRITPLKGFPIEGEVSESGSLFIPHMGIVDTIGVTPGELQDSLRVFFDGMLQDALVVVERTRSGGAVGSGQRVGTVRGAVSLEDIPQRFIVMGDISQPGVYSLGPNLRLREAIALAGGLDARRASRMIYLVRGSRDTPEVHRINMNDILYGKDLAGNVLLQNNDAIYVPTRHLWRMADFVNTLLSPIMGVRDTIWMYDRLR